MPWRNSSVALSWKIEFIRQFDIFSAISTNLSFNCGGGCNLSLEVGNGIDMANMRLFLGSVCSLAKHCFVIRRPWLCIPMLLLKPDFGCTHTSQSLTADEHASTPSVHAFHKHHRFMYCWTEVSSRRVLLLSCVYVSWGLHSLHACISLLEVLPSSKKTTHCMITRRSANQFLPA